MVGTFFFYFVIFFVIAKIISRLAHIRWIPLAERTVKQDSLLAVIFSLTAAGIIALADQGSATNIYGAVTEKIIFCY